MNQGKLKVVIQEMIRVNINILGISELKWMRKDNFISDDHYIYYYGQESHRRSEVAFIVNKESEMQYSSAISKKDRMISVHFQVCHSISQ